MNDFGTTKEEIDYKTFLKYIETLKKSGIKIITIQKYIGSLKVYFNYLQEDNYRSNNPIESIVVKGKPKKVLSNLLSQEELEDLYYSYPVKEGNLSSKRNKIIVGLLVYQGLQTSELPYLTEEYLELYKGKINVPSSLKINERTLYLKPWQLIDMIEYINQYKSKEQDYLLVTNYGKTNLNNVLRRISKVLKRMNYNYQNASQIRSSVIVNWLKIHHLRKVQIMAGHRYISSTERYKQEDLESLHEMIDNFHPIK